MRRFVQAFSSDDLPASWSSPLRETLAERVGYNIGKGDDASILRMSEKMLVSERMRWGLVPSWSKEPETRYTTVTSRLDRASRSRIFANAWRHRHCVLPLTGYYKLDRTTRPAIPHFIHHRDGQVLLVAGLWEAWDKGDVPLHSFTILTHPTDAIPKPLAPDGPVFLTEASARRWLESGGSWLAGALLRMSAEPPLVSYAVSNAYRDRARDDYTLLEPRSAEAYLEPSLLANSEDEDDEED